MTVDEKCVQVLNLDIKIQKLKNWWLSQIGLLNPEKGLELAELELQSMKIQDTPSDSIFDTHIELTHEDIMDQYELDI